MNPTDPRSAYYQSDILSYTAWVHTQQKGMRLIFQQKDTNVTTIISKRAFEASGYYNPHTHIL